MTVRRRPRSRRVRRYLDSTLMDVKVWYRCICLVLFQPVNVAAGSGPETLDPNQQT
jgi:hypothetical protein